MDGFKNAAAQGGMCLSCCLPLLCGCGLLGGAITLTVYLGKFAYQNPDPEDCWAVRGLDKTYTSLGSA